MLQDAIKAITQAEAQVRADIAAAEQRAEQMAVDARAAGEQAVAHAGEKAEAKLVELERQIALRSEEYVSEQQALLEKELESLRRRAEYRLERAASLAADMIKEL